MVLEEHPIKHLPGYFANSVGGIRGPTGYLQQFETKSGHLLCNINYRTYCVHRLVAYAFGIVNPCPARFKQIDHINRNPWDNRPANLRWLSHQLNGMNNDALNVSWVKRWRKWKAEVRANGKNTYLGFHKTFHAAYQKAQLFKHAEFQRIYQKHINEAAGACPGLLRGRRDDLPATA